MGDGTGIAWTDATWNPTRGCSLVSAGCTNCYAMRTAARWNGPGQAYEGLTRPTGHGPVWSGKITTVPEMLYQPLRWARPRRIFVNSMSDLFHENAPRAFVVDVFAVMSLASWHTFQVLTKRPQIALALLSDPTFHREVQLRAMGLGETFNRWRRRRVDEIGDGTLFEWPLPNLHLGISAEDQDALDARLPDLIQTPAAVRFLSCEPLLGPLDLTMAVEAFQTYAADLSRNPAPIDWIIVGGESGPRARECDMAWLHAIVGQCRAAQVPVFMKQLGSFCRHAYGKTKLTWPTTNRAGADPAEWPEDLCVQEFPVNERDPNGLDPHTAGAKLDAGKLDLTLVPPALAEQVARVMMHGVEKYRRGGWRYVPDAPMRYCAAAERHLLKWKRGEDIDPATGLHHLAQVACNIGFLLAFYEEGQDIGAWRDWPVPPVRSE